MHKADKYKMHADYYIVLFICIAFVIIALVLDSPGQIAQNYYRINASRSVLITDYIALAGIGAALVNAAILGFINLLLLKVNKREPDGRIIAALFVTIGFSLFGKNLFNTLPIMMGVWLYAKVTKAKFSTLLVQAMLSGTIAPIVSEIAFLNDNGGFVRIIAAYMAGLFIGFIFPVVVEAVKRLHRGYCLYNGGIAGGFIATFFVGLLRSVGIDILPENFWDTEHSFFLAIFAYAIAVSLIIYGAVREKPAYAFRRFLELIKERDHQNNDYFVKYGDSCYINIGVMCILSTSVMLLLGIPVNGPVLGGILTVSGFAAAGKHFVNAAPVLAGSIAGAYFNHIDVTASVNSLAILFSTGLAPVCGKHGWLAGIAVGFLHVSVAIFIGNLNGGLNLYNNGFAEGFVAITIVPVIVFFKEILKKHKPADGNGEGIK